MNFKNKLLRVISYTLIIGVINIINMIDNHFLISLLINDAIKSNYVPVSK